MQLAYFPITYLSWHYGRGLISCVQTLSNFLWFIWHYFAIDTHLKTLLSPWHKRFALQKGEKYPASLMLGILFWNLASRIVGLVARSFTVLCGFICLALALPIFLALIAFWILLPVLIVGFLLKGLILIFKHG